MTARAFSRRTSSSIWRTSKGDEAAKPDASGPTRSEEHTSELQSRSDLVCRLLLEKKKKRVKLGRRCCSHVRDSQDTLSLRYQVPAFYVLQRNRAKRYQAHLQPKRQCLER